VRISHLLLLHISLCPSQVLLSYNIVFLLLLKCAHLSLAIIAYLSVPLSAFTLIMFDWALFEALHSYVKILTYYGEEFPLSVALVLGNMTFAFIMLFIVAALWTIQFSDHVAQVFDNTIDIMLEFQVSLQQVMGPDGLHQQTSPQHEFFWSSFTDNILTYTDAHGTSMTPE